MTPPDVPPPGPDALERAARILGHRTHTMGFEPCPDCARVAREIEAAVIKAHEQDARAGCGFCGRGYVPIFRGVYGWLHDEDQGACLRPEVHDALARLRSSSEPASPKEQE